MKIVAVCSGPPVDSIDFSRGNSAEKKLFTSMRASAAPRQKCTPWPKATCLLGSRATSNPNGSVKTSSSRFADG